MDLGWIGIDAPLAIEHERIGLDRVPQRAGDLEKLLRPLVAGIVVHHHVEAVVGGLVLVGRSHRIPGDAAARDVVERVEHPRAVERMVIGGRHGHGEADALRGLRHERDHRRHVVPRPLGAVAHHRMVIAAVILRGPAGIAEEQHVHHAAFGDAGDVLVEFGRAVIGIADPGPWHAPEIVRVEEREVRREMDRF